MWVMCDIMKEIMISIVKFGTWFWLFMFVVFIVIIYFLNVKSYKSEYKDKKIKSYPKELTSVELSMLMYKKIIPEVFTVTILELIIMGKIQLKIRGLDYELLLNENINYKLSKSQEEVLKILFASIALDKKTSLSKLAVYANNKSNGVSFFNDYYIWKRLAQAETFQTRFYEEKIGYNLIVIYKYIAFLLVVINILISPFWFISYLLLIFSALLSLFFYKSYRRTKEANDEYHKWKSFKVYLEGLNENELSLDNKERTNFLRYGVILKLNPFIKHKVFKGMDKFIYSLNKIIKKCSINAEFYGHREIKW